MSTVEIKGLRELLSALERYPDIVQRELEQSADAAMMSLLGDLASYPPAPAASKYTRSGQLGRLWTSATPEFSASSSGFEATLGNATPYGVWVQDPEDQAWMHAGRWKDLQAILTEHQAEIESYFEAALERVTRAIEDAT